jgi:putative exporter of polyketide antibiotics
VLALPVLATLALVAVAVALVARRDHGAGLLPERPGPATASPRLRSPSGLAWRLQRGALLGWALGFAAAGAVTGAVAKDVGDLFRGNQQFSDLLRRLGGSGLVNAYLAAVMGLLGLVAAGYMIQAVLRVRAEETATRAEPVLAAPVGVAFALCLALGQVGELLRLPGWVLDLSPLRHTPQLPAAAATAGPLLLLVAAALALAFLGLVGIGRRDIL